MKWVPAIVAAAWCTLACGAATAESNVWVAKLLQRVPRTEADMAEAFAASKDGCVQVPAGDPLQAPELALETFYDVTLPVEGRMEKQKRRFEFARLGVLSFGSHLLPEDEAGLPVLSKQRIVRRVAGDYVALQARLHRDAESGSVYLYHKPFAAVGSFGQTESAGEFAPVMEDSVRQVRGLGLFLDPDRKQVEADDLRTLVIVSQTLMVPQAAPAEGEQPAAGAPGPALDLGALRPSYRLIFVRAREKGDGFELHSFVTSPDGKLWAYLPPYEEPAAPDDCTVTSDIVFTGYTAAKQSPTGKASRSLEVHPRARYAVAALDAWLAGEGRAGGALDHLTLALDAVIDGRVAPIAGP